MGAKLTCPKGYGEIEFKERVNKCPISGSFDCVRCNIIPWHKMDEETRQVETIKKE